MENKNREVLRVTYMINTFLVIIAITFLMVFIFITKEKIEFSILIIVPIIVAVLSNLTLLRLYLKSRKTVD